MIAVVDTSALIAVLFNEPDRRMFDGFLRSNPSCIAVGTIIETHAVMQRHRGRRDLDWVGQLLDLYGTMVLASDEAQLAFAREGLERFGQGRRAPPAVLNFGDLFAYALARQLDAPLLYKGDDFTHTDVRPALTA